MNVGFRGRTHRLSERLGAVLRLLAFNAAPVPYLPLARGLGRGDDLLPDLLTLERHGLVRSEPLGVERSRRRFVLADGVRL